MGPNIPFIMCIWDANICNVIYLILGDQLKPYSAYLVTKEKYSISKLWFSLCSITMIFVVFSSLGHFFRVKRVSFHFYYPPPFLSTRIAAISSWHLHICLASPPVISHYIRHNIMSTLPHFNLMCSTHESYNNLISKLVW